MRLANVLGPVSTWNKPRRRGLRHHTIRHALRHCFFPFPSGRRRVSTPSLILSSQRGYDLTEESTCVAGRSIGGGSEEGRWMTAAGYTSCGSVLCTWGISVLFCTRMTFGQANCRLINGWHFSQRKRRLFAFGTNCLRKNSNA